MHNIAARNLVFPLLGKFFTIYMEESLILLKELLKPAERSLHILLQANIIVVETSGKI